MTAPRDSAVRQASAYLHGHPRLRLAGVLTAPVLWLGVAYVGSLAALLVTAFWQVDPFTTEITRSWTLQNFVDIATVDVYRTITLRTIAVALAVTVIDAVVALPIAFYMAKVASPRTARWLVVAVLMPLWASYLVKAYAWRVMTIDGGVLDGSVGVSPGFGLATLVLTLAYLWLPYMILPIYAGLERMPNSLLDASADLGAHAGRTLRSVVFPIIVPAVFAGSVFTFSLSLGDYIAVEIVGGANQMLGTVVYDNVGAANNLPFAAAMASLSVLVMLGYLAAVRRTGALESL
jgi:putative spermidine/putrescine transport system permease protein